MSDFTPVFLRTFNNYDVDPVSDSVRTVNDEASLTIQSDFEDTEINGIVRRFGVTGMLPNGGVTMPTYGDFTNDVVDYKSALNILRDADEQFMSLPSDLRARFSNSPAKLLDFLNDSGNMDEAVKLGLVKADSSAVVEPNSASPEGTSGETNAEVKANAA